MPATIYLHWAPPLHLGALGCITSIISGDGRLRRLHAYSIDLPATTYVPGDETANALWPVPVLHGLLAPDPWSIPPTEAQLNANVPRDRCDRAAAWGWVRPNINHRKVMTHEPRRPPTTRRVRLDARQLTARVILGW